MGLTAGALVLAGCASAVGVEVAPNADDRLCAEVMVRLPTEIDGGPRRDTTAQSTAAWGEGPVVLRCGVDDPGPSTDPCLRIDGVDWVQTGADDEPTFTTYGRVPALEVVVPDSAPGPDVVLAALAPAAGAIPQTAACL